ncbi:hypothetical protein T492DRAFT_879982, partial [Pavlovales sp. CCMP2436]
PAPSEHLPCALVATARAALAAEEGGAEGGGSLGQGALCVFDAVADLLNAVALSQTLPERAASAAAEARPQLRALRARALAAAAAAEPPATPAMPSAALAAACAPSPAASPLGASLGMLATPERCCEPATPSTGGSAAASASAAAAQWAPASAAVLVVDEASAGALALLTERLLAPLSAAHCLLLLDNVSPSLRADAQLGRLVSALLRCRRVRLLCTCARPLGLALAGTAEKVVHLPPLDSATIARLVVRAAPRPLLRSELERTTRRLHAEASAAGAPPPGSSMLATLARHELVVNLIQGMPARLYEVVSQLHNASLDELASRWLQQRVGGATAAPDLAGRAAADVGAT